MLTYNFNSNQVRVLIKDDKPYFVAEDIYRVLGISIEGTEKDIDGIHKISGQGVISESELYDLILDSAKVKEAKGAKKWLLKKLLPVAREVASSKAIISLEERFSELSQKVEEIEVRLSTAIRDSKSGKVKLEDDLDLALKYLRKKIESETVFYRDAKGIDIQQGGISSQVIKQWMKEESDKWAFPRPITNKDIPRLMQKMGWSVKDFAIGDHRWILEDKIKDSLE